MRVRKSIVQVMIVLVFIPGVVSAVTLKTAAQESSPKYFMKNGKMEGICIDILKAVANADPELLFTGYDAFLPFKRLQNALEEGRIDVFFGLKNSAKRKGRYIFSPTPLYTINYVVAVRADDQVHVTSFDDIRVMGAEEGRILTVTGAAAGRFLQKQEGLHVEDKAKTPVALLKMLVAKRGRFAFYHDLGLKNVIKQERLEGLVRVLPTSFLQYHHSLAFTNSTPAATVLKVQTALDKVVVSGELEKIQHKYGLMNF